MGYAVKWLFPPFVLFMLSFILHLANARSKTAEVLGMISIVWGSIAGFFVFIYIVGRVWRRATGNPYEKHFPR